MIQSTIRRVLPGVLPLSVAVMCLGATPSSAQAGLIGGHGTWGDFTGNMTYHATDAGHSTLTIELTNVSPVPNGGYLTGFVFNKPVGYITGVTYNFSDPDFALLGAPTFDNNVKGAPYGYFDIGAALGGSFEGGGTPSNGLAIGQSATFQFHFVGAHLDQLSVESFLAQLSVPPADGEGHESLVVRFKGFSNGRSDKVPLTYHNPEPSSLLMFAFGTMGIAGFARRRSRIA